MVARCEKPVQVKSGDKLKNGATVLHTRQAGVRGDQVIVLAECGGHHPFVTWWLSEDGGAYWGHYHARLDEAVADFYAR